jgi:orotate phosphoribosyltransferase
VTDDELLRTLLLERSLSRGDFVLSSGRRSNYYIDARKTTMSSSGQGVIGGGGRGALRGGGWGARAVGGLTLGADPVAYAIARASLDAPPQIDAFSVRKAAKEHGTRRLIEGCFEPGDSVVVVEDVITSGGSALQAISVLRQAGAAVLGVVAVVDRQQGGRQQIETAGISVVSLTTITALDASL